MKYLIIIFVGLSTFCPTFLNCQNLSIGLTTGINSSFSNYYDVAIDPQKTFISLKPNVSITIDYAPFKKGYLFLTTGVGFSYFSNAFKVEEAPYFGKNEGFKKIQQTFSSFKIPLCVGFRHRISKQIGFTSLFGISFLQTNRASFKEAIVGTQKRTIDGSDYELEYEFYFRSINKQTFTIDFGIGIFYDISKQLSFEASLLQQLGLTPILSSLVDYKIINKTNPSTLIGDAYVTSKADALSLVFGLKYKFRK